MNVFINAISIHGGGPFVVLVKSLEYMQRLAPNINWYIASQPKILDRLPDGKNIIKLPFAKVKDSPVRLIHWYEFVLPRLLRQTKADICYSQTNYLPNRKLPCPSLLLMQHAGHFSEEYTRLLLSWKKIKWVSHFLWNRKTNWVYKSIKRATYVTVQTHDLAKHIIEKVKVPSDKIKVIPHGSGLISLPLMNPKRYQPQHVWRIGYITRFGVQKDFDTACKAIHLLKQHVPCKLLLTIDKTSAEYPAICNLIQSYGIENEIENHGEVNQANQVTQLYHSLDFFIFPSLCESFGFTLVEAMASGLPLVVADTPSNIEMVGHAGKLFTARKAEHLVEVLRSIIQDEALYYELSAKSIERAKSFCWDKSSEALLNLFNQLSHKKEALKLKSASRCDNSCN